jgi:diguanylate cyclase (GGDEF)-like protein
MWVEEMHVLSTNAIAPAAEIAHWHLTDFMPALALTVGAGLWVIYRVIRIRSSSTPNITAFRTEPVVTTLSPPGHVIFAIDAVGQIISFNSHGNSWLGTSDGQVLHHSKLDALFISDDYLGGFTHAVLATIREGIPLRRDTRMRSIISAECRAVEVCAYPNLSSSGQVGALVVVTDTPGCRQVERHVAYLAGHDQLTGLPNRSVLRVLLAEKLFSHARPFCLLYLDLDHFKHVNESLGHITGDMLLKEVAERLVACTPCVEMVARLGGDEFLMLVDFENLAHLREILENVMGVFHPEFCQGNYRLTLTASIGAAIYPDHGFDFDSLLQVADVALHGVKLAGRNGWAFHDEGMSARQLRNWELGNGLRQAFQSSDLYIHYQPQINLLSNEVVGAEALLRWRHLGNEIISPVEFIPLAEESGLIVPISNWLLLKVCRQAVEWQKLVCRDLTIAVNCSAIQFTQGDFVSEVKAALTDSGLNPKFLELELTESILIADASHVIDVLNQIRSLGVKISIDDFGTGYSSMRYLKQFSVDKIKIDQSFVRGMLVNPKDLIIVRSLISLAHSLNLEVIAEGVESQEICEALIDLGCIKAQGYFFATPLSASEFTQHIIEGKTGVWPWRAFPVRA